jgi:hypothetical protein
MDSFDCTLYPNPAAEELFIRSQRDLTQVVVRIIDQGGKEMRSIPLGTMSEDDAMKIPLNGIANGTYLLLIESAEGYYSQEFVKLD